MKVEIAGLVAVVAFSTIAVPAEEVQGAGLTVEIEGWWSTPRGVELDYAFLPDAGAQGGNLSGGGDVSSLLYSGESSIGFTVRKRFLSRPASPALHVSFWEQDATARATTGPDDGNVGALLASPDFALGRSVVDLATANGEISARRIDAAFAWQPFRTDKTTVEALAGMRLFRLESEAVVTYESDTLGLLQQEVVNRFTDASGIGPLVVARFGYRFGDVVRVGAEMGLAFPIGDLEASATDQIVGGPRTVIEREGTRTAFLQLQGETWVAFRVVRWLHLELAYRFEHWGGAVRELQFVDDVSQNSAVALDRDVSFDGFSVSLRTEF